MRDFPARHDGALDIRQFHFVIHLCKFYRHRKDSFRFELIGVHDCWATLVRRVLRVSGSGRKSHCASAPVPPEPPPAPSGATSL
jgi:hypothetical protein